jgi:hypothetical protein
MSNQDIGIDELTKKRTPSELLNWVKWKMDQIGSTDEGERILRLHEGFAKQLIEEVYPLAIFGSRKFGDTDQILMQPIIGNQSYDAVLTDLRSKPASESYVEITQSHEGENDYLRRLDLQRKGFSFGHSPVNKKGTKKTGLQFSINPKVVTPGEVAGGEKKRILDAARRKEAKDYPANTSLIIVFNDDLFFRQAVDDAHLDTFVRENILKLDLRFSLLCLIGWQRVFREFRLGKSG